MNSIATLLLEAAKNPQYLRPDAEALVALAAEHEETLCGASVIEGPAGSKQASDLLKSRVKFCLRELLIVMRALDLKSLSEIVQRYERLVAVQWAALTRSSSGPPLPVSMPSDLLDAEDSVALRFCVEVAAAHGETGNVAMADEVFHRAWSLAREVLYCGGLQDALETGLTDVRAVREHGRLRLACSDAFEAAARGQRNALLAESPAYEHAPPDELTEELNDAVGEEVGLALADIIALLQDLRDVSQQDGSVQIADRDQVIAELATSVYSTEEVKAGLAYVSLSSGTGFKPSRDRYPWRFRREQSYLTRPILDIARENRAFLIWGPLSTESWLNVLDTAYLTKARKAKTKRLNRAIEGLHAWHSNQLEERIADHFRADERFLVERGVEKPIGSIVCYKPEHQLGDMDVIVIDRVCRLIVLIEAKGRTPGLVPSNIAKEVGDWDAIVEKHERRVRWLNDNLAEFLEYREISSNCQELWMTWA